MKKLNIILSVMLFTCTTALIILFPLTVTFAWDKLGLLCCLSLVGYLGAYLYFDNYIDFIREEELQNTYRAWREGYDAGYNQGVAEYKQN